MSQDTMDDYDDGFKAGWEEARRLVRDLNEKQLAEQEAEKHFNSPMLRSQEWIGYGELGKREDCGPCDHGVTAPCTCVKGQAVRDPGWHHCVPCAKAHPGYITSACEQWWNGAENRAVLLAGDPAPHSADDVLALRCLKHATIPPTILPPAKTECGLCMRDEGILSGSVEVEIMERRLEDLDLLKDQTRCPECDCSTPGDAERSECGCDGVVCSREGSLAECYKGACEEVEKLREALHYTQENMNLVVGTAWPRKHEPVGPETDGGTLTPYGTACAALNLAVALLHDLDGNYDVEPLARAEIRETLARIDKIMEGL